MEPEVKSSEIMDAIRKEWGPEQVYVKIVELTKEKKQIINLDTLIQSSSIEPGYKAFAAATCFTSIAKLKVAGLIRIFKNPYTHEISHITLVGDEENMLADLSKLSINN